MPVTHSVGLISFGLSCHFGGGIPAGSCSIKGQSSSSASAGSGKTSSSSANTVSMSEGTRHQEKGKVSEKILFCGFRVKCQLLHFDCAYCDHFSPWGSRYSFLKNCLGILQFGARTDTRHKILPIHYIYIQSFSRCFYPKRLTMYTHFTFYIYTDGTLHIRSNQGFSVLLKDTSTGNRTSNLLITKRLLYLLYHCRPYCSL